MTKRQDSAVIRQMKDRGVFDPEAFERFLCSKGWSWRQLDRGEIKSPSGAVLDLQMAQTLFVFQDPVRWCEAYLLNPDDGEPWRFFDYQKPSARSWMQDVVHQDGAEVGKTREIIALLLWSMCTSFGLTKARPSNLVGAPQQSHLDEIIQAVEEQMGVAEGMENRQNPLRHFWLKPKRSPHTTLKFLSPNPQNPKKPMIGRVYFRPGSHDGEAFRGIHVNGLAFFDEAAKAKHRKVFDEFTRAMMPGCHPRYYSVPDGDNTTEYYRLTQIAVRDLPPDQPGIRLFHWPKTIMPAPFWNKERDRDMRRQYGGRNTPGYQRNVMGQHGQAENPVWTVDTIMPNITDLPGYRCLSLTVEGGSLQVELKRVGLEIQDGQKSPREHWLEDATLDMADFQAGDEELREAMRELLRSRLSAAGDGIYWAGADLGEQRDPTEILVTQELGPKLEDRVRIHARGMPYRMQRELIYCLDELFAFKPHWGVDLGGAGTVVVRDLQNMDAYIEAHYDERLTGFNFSETVNCEGEDGEVLTEPDKNRDGESKVVRARAKHWSTQLITQRMQTVGYAMAYDPPVIGHYQNHTAREGTREPIYAKQDDHTIDARRVLMLRKIFDETGAVDAFSAGSHRRNAA